MPKRLSNTVIAMIAGCSSLLCVTPSNAAEYAVEINKTQIMRLPAPAASVVIGNPQIADITVHSSDTLLLNGRGYGETNIIVFDQFGRTVLNTDVQVTPPTSDSSIRVNFIGKGQETYSCTPHCSPSPIHGDAPGFISEFEGDAITNNNPTATGPTTTLPPQSAPPPFDPSAYQQQR